MNSTKCNQPDNMNSNAATTAGVYTGNQRKPFVEIQVDLGIRPNFTNLTDDHNLLENLNRFCKCCELLNISAPQMFRSLALAIGIQNEGKYSVLIYDYLLASPQYPPVVNGKKEPLYGKDRFCTMVCYNGKLFGIVVFPATEKITFYFPGLKTYSPQVQQFLFTYGNRVIRYCAENRALAIDYKPDFIPQDKDQDEGFEDYVILEKDHFSDFEDSFEIL